MTISEIPTPIIMFILGHSVAIAWALITLFFDVKALKIQAKEMHEENVELRKQLKDINDTLLIVRNNTELLMLGKLKTSSGK
jgi:hypothetical protein